MATCNTIPAHAKPSSNFQELAVAAHEDILTFESYSKAAQQGHADAQYRLAQWYAPSLVLTEAEKVYSIFYIKGEPRLPDRIAQALPWYQSAAEQGHVQAQRCLGDYYGDAGDEVMACHWYHKAAEQGETTAQVEIAVRLAQGTGVAKRDEARALAWYCQASQQAGAEATSTLLVDRLAHGRGIEVGLLVAKYYAHGPEAGHPCTEPNAAFWYVQVASARPKHWRAEPCVAEAQCRVGQAFAQGEWGLEKNEADAFAWYGQAAVHGNATAQLETAARLLQGRGVQPDAAQGFDWLLKAARQGCVAAQCKLSAWLAQGCQPAGEQTEKGEQAYGWGHEAKNSAGRRLAAYKAALWYQRAVFGHDPHAQFRLGLCYEAGTGVARDAVRAGAWYARSAAQGYAAAELRQGFVATARSNRQVV